MVEVGNDFDEVVVEVELVDDYNHRPKHEVMLESDVLIIKVLVQLMVDDVLPPMSMQQLDEVSLDLLDDDFSLSDRENNKIHHRIESHSNKIYFDDNRIRKIIFMNSTRHNQSITSPI